MKNTHTTHFARNGFSLVEILVVIAIISVLAASAFVAASKINKNSKLENNRSLATILERGIENFYDDYGYYPIDKADDTVLTSSEQVALLQELAGKGNTFNTKGKNFIESMATASNGRNGLVYSSSGDIQSLADSFGGSFSIILDGTYDDEITEPSELGDNEIKGKRSLIWCYGEDAADTKDIITTWR